MEFIPWVLLTCSLFSTIQAPPPQGLKPASSFRVNESTAPITISEPEKSSVLGTLSRWYKIVKDALFGEGKIFHHIYYSTGEQIPRSSRTSCRCCDERTRAQLAAPDRDPLAAYQRQTMCVEMCENLGSGHNTSGGNSSNGNGSGDCCCCFWSCGSGSGNGSSSACCSDSNSGSGSSSGCCSGGNSGGGSSSGCCGGDSSSNNSGGGGCCTGLDSSCTC